MPEFRIVGINKMVASFFDEYCAASSRRNSQKIAEHYYSYIEKLKTRFANDNISPACLTPQSRSAMMTMEGLACLALNRPHIYCEIYRIVNNERKRWKKFARGSLLLKFIASQKLRFSLQRENSYLIFNLPVMVIPFPERYFKLISRYLFGKFQRKNTHRHLLDEIYAFERRLSNSISPPRKPDQEIHVFKLTEVFDDLNLQYFSGTLKTPLLRWSSGQNFRRLGSYDFLSNTITISRLLDNPEVPHFVIKGLVHHEILHMLHPVQVRNGRRVIHGPEFHQMEQQFDEHREFKNWLKLELPRLVKRNRSKARKAG